ncbi:NAD kinase 2, mitochondrial, partial [Geodia barretti]
GYLTEQLCGVFSGRYQEMRRQRIRVTLESRKLPVLALNEVFVGEKDISHSSYYEISHDGSPSERQKSSGLLVYTGSGSTSWFVVPLPLFDVHLPCSGSTSLAYNMNRVSSETVQKLLHIAGEIASLPAELSQPQLAQNVSEVFNYSNVFGGEEQTMAFTVREPIIRGIFAVGRTHGFAKTVKVVSRSWNANLVVDGHYCTDFPNGSTALLELQDSDSLRTLTSSSPDSSPRLHQHSPHS